MSRRIGLVGFFGWGNYGDELMREVWQTCLPWPAELMHDLLTAPYFSASASEATRFVDGIVIGGGDLVLARTVSPLYWNRAWLHHPCAVSGIGVALEQDEFRTDVAPRIRDFLAHEQVVSVSTRDAASAQWLQEATGVPEVRCAADLAFAAPLPVCSPLPDGPLPSLSPGDRVALVIRKSMSPEITEAVERVLSWATERGADAEFLVAATDSEAVADRSVIHDRWPGVKIRQEATVAGITSALADYRVVASAKFHVTLMCARMGVPTLVLRTTNKTQQLAGQLLDPRTSRVVQADDDQRLLDELCAAPLQQRGLPALEERARAEVQHVVDALARSFSDASGGAVR